MKIELLNSNDTQIILDMANSFTTYYPTKQSIENYINNEYNFIYTVSFKESIIGFIHLLNATDVYELINIYVSPEYRNRGIASDLINFVKNFINMPIILEVENLNYNAIKLYEKLGFKEIYSRKNYYGNDRNAIIMRLECEK